jgi:thymidylate kinase
LARPRGNQVQIVGPDGSGKTTLAVALTAALSPRTEAVHFYWRPAVLPMPGHWIGKREYGPVPDPHGRPAHSALKSTARLVYFFIDFTIGYWWKYRPVLCRGGVVVTERGWQDLVVDPRRYLMSSNRPAKLLGALLPRPDVVVILSAPTDVVLGRKRELSAIEIERQVRDWEALATARKCVVHLDSSLAVGELVRRVIDLLNRL